MEFSDHFYLNIKEIFIAHQHISDRDHFCSYPNGRGQYGLVYALRGGAEYRFFSGERIKMDAGDMIFLFPHNAYTLFIEKEFEHYTVNFDLHENHSEFDTLNQSYCLLKDESTQSMERTFRKLVGTWQTKKAGSRMQAVGFLYELLSQFYDQYTKEHGSPNYQRLNAAKEYIEQHYQESIPLAKLAFLSNMSPAHFRREWKKIYDQSPLQYRDSIRLYYAREYLRSGYYSIGEIGEKCGFDDVSYFVRFFKKHTGVTPARAQKHLAVK